MFLNCLEIALTAYSKWKTTYLRKCTQMRFMAFKSRPTPSPSASPAHHYRTCTPSDCSQKWGLPFPQAKATASILEGQATISHPSPELCVVDLKARGLRGLGLPSLHVG